MHTIGQCGVRRSLGDCSVLWNAYHRIGHPKNSCYGITDNAQSRMGAWSEVTQFLLDYQREKRGGLCLSRFVQITLDVCIIDWNRDKQALRQERCSCCLHSRKASGIHIVLIC